MAPKKKGKGKANDDVEMAEAGPSGVDAETAAARRKEMEMRVETQRKYVVCGPDVNFHTNSTIAANQYKPLGIDASFKLAEFRRGLGIEVTRYDGYDMEFEVKGISCAMANTLRRIMIAEVPTMAIEHVFIVNNTSIIQDEVLAHRLGLIPLAVDPRLFEFRAAGDAATKSNTIVMKLKIECKMRPDGSFINEKVFSRDLQWLPEGSELPDETGVRFEGSQKDIVDAVNPVHDDILIAKLRPGQSIELECHCTKGVGEEHAKWSPVATTWYRLMPEVALLRQPDRQVAEKLAAELPGLVTVGKNGNVVVGEARRHEKLLEKVRRMSGEEEWKPYIELRKRKDHFIFTIESTGAWKPHELFQEAVDRIMAKCDKVLEGLASFPEPSFEK